MSKIVVSSIKVYGKTRICYILIVCNGIEADIRGTWIDVKLLLFCLIALRKKFLTTKQLVLVTSQPVPRHNLWTCQGTKSTGTSPQTCQGTKSTGTSPQTRQGTKSMGTSPQTCQGTKSTGTSPQTCQGTKSMDTSPQTCQGTKSMGTSPQTCQGTKSMGTSPPTCQGTKSMGTSPQTCQGTKSMGTSPQTCQGTKSMGTSPQTCKGTKSMGTSLQTCQGTKFMGTSQQTCQGTKSMDTSPHNFWTATCKGYRYMISIILNCNWERWLYWNVKDFGSNPLHYLVISLVCQVDYDFNKQNLRFKSFALQEATRLFRI